MFRKRCDGCKVLFCSESEFLLHLSVDGFCRFVPERVIREFVHIVLYERS